MAELPSGTVTFLFTDVEGSTTLLHELGAEAYAAALAEHRRIVREASAAEDGVEVDTQGDAFFVAFPTAPGALQAAHAITERLDSGPIRVRMGLHTGEPLLTEEGYVGADVHFAARVAGSGHGGQVVLSKATAELASTELTDLGEHRLKDIAEPVQIFQLGSERFPPLKTISNTNLPRPASSFVGRERELEEVLDRMERARLVTLTGPGGSGKTRLAVEAASTLVPEYKAGVFWVGLASLRDPGLVTEQISQTLGAKDGLAEHVGERELLLLLDNLEQVVEAAPELSALVEACPNLSLLCTSRELLRVQGEVEYAVPPLASPEAVRLFCERSQLEATEGIAELCARLDDLPLAVELAAARTKALTSAQILERLSSRLDLLKGGRDADPRQQTLRATIAWSYDLLPEEEQRLFRSLSVFAGGCTLEAAEDVAGADLDTMQSLVEKSLLRFTDGRYWMLETIREYARELWDPEEAERLGWRHAEYFRSLALLAEEHLDGGPAQRGWLDRLEQERHNLDRALSFLEPRDHEALIRLAVAVWMFWLIHAHFAEARGWLRKALALNPQLSLERRGALEAAAYLAYAQGDVEHARPLAEEQLVVAERLGHGPSIAQSLHILAHLEDVSGRRDRAIELYERSLSYEGHPRRADTLYSLGAVTLLDGDTSRAIDWLEQSRAVNISRRDDWALATDLLALGYAHHSQGHDDVALDLMRQGLALGLSLGEKRHLANSLDGIAAVLAGSQPADAASLLGAAEILREEIRLPSGGLSRHWNPLTCEILLRQLGECEVDMNVAHGRSLPLEDVLTLALGRPVSTTS